MGDAHCRIDLEGQEQAEGQEADTGDIWDLEAREICDARPDQQTAYAERRKAAAKDPKRRTVDSNVKRHQLGQQRGLHEQKLR